jgi:hypothetical protein
MGKQVVPVDLIDLAHLMAGGTLVIKGTGIELVPASDIFRVTERVRVRINATKRTSKDPRPSKEKDEGQ